MRLTAQQKIRAGFGLLLILPTLLCILAVQNINTLIVSAEKVAHTDEVLASLTDTLSALKDVEVHEREYILTGNESFLAGFNTSEKTVLDQIAKLRKQVAGNTPLQDKTNLLQD